MAARKLKKSWKIAFTLIAVVAVLGLVYWGWSALTGDDNASAERSAQGARLAPESAPARAEAASRTSGNSDDTIVVCVNTWPGFAGGQWFNGGFAASTDSRFYQEYGLLVEFLVEDDFEKSRARWKADECHLVWQTVDAFNTEVAGLRDAGHDPRFFLQIDWSRGGDAVVAAPDITSMADLRGRRVAFAPGTPSHTLFLRLLEAAGMKMSDVVAVEAKDAIAAAQMFQNGEVDAAVVWAPDDEISVDAVPGSSVLIDTKDADRVIADTLLVKAGYLRDHRRELVALSTGWLRGNAAVNTDPDARREAVGIIAAGYVVEIDGVDVFDVPAAEEALGKVRLTTLGDNRAFFGLDRAAGMDGARLFRESAELYQANGFTGLVPRIVPWEEVADTSVLDRIRLGGSEHAAEPARRFERPQVMAEAIAAPAIAEKSVTVTFPTNSAVLDSNMKRLIDLEFGSTIASIGGPRIRIEGNTDSTGPRERNMQLSRDRANAVADFLATKYGLDPDRFIISGNGPDNPVCREETAECRERNRRTEFALVRLVEALP